MTYSLSDAFNDPAGRWNEFAPWDGTEASDANKGFLTTQEHIDLRSFRVIGDLDPRPQTDLESPVIQTTLEGETQTQMETKPAANLANENWVLSGTGLNAITVGEISGRGGWSGLITTTQNSAVDATLTSSITTAIDISLGTSLSIVFPDYNTWDGDSYVQMTSDPAGAFGTGHDSAQVAFSANTSVMPELRLPIASFAQSGFDNTKVTGVRIRLHHAAVVTPGLSVTVMAIRAVTASWVVSWLDFDTRIGAICRPVTLNGLPTTGTVAQAFQFVRGDHSKLDPIPADLGIDMYFYPGGFTTPNDATGATYNTVAFILRETKDMVDSPHTGSHIEVGLQFNDSATNFYAKKVDTSNTVPTVTGSYTVSVGGPLDPAKHFLFHVEIKGTQILPKLYSVHSDHSIIQQEWIAPVSITNSAYAYRNGRVGFIADLQTRDAYVDAINVAPTGFAELITQQYKSRTPVDGAQLSAVYAADLNLWTGVSGSSIVLDTNKTISGNGAYRTSGAMTTNSFLVDDWTQMYLDLSIWVSSAVTFANQPEILLNTGSGQETLFTDALKPAQWNNLYFDLGVFRNLLTGSQYSFTIQPKLDPDQPLGLYWVDSVTIGRRRVSWSARATATSPWREFKEAVNNPNGGVHFIPEERGTLLQIKADALTEDAWVSSFHVFPRYAQLGLPLWDKGGTYEAFDAGQ